MILYSLAGLNKYQEISKPCLLKMKPVSMKTQLSCVHILYKIMHCLKTLERQIHLKTSKISLHRKHNISAL